MSGESQLEVPNASINFRRNGSDFFQISFGLRVNGHIRSIEFDCVQLIVFDS